MVPSGRQSDLLGFGHVGEPNTERPPSSAAASSAYIAGMHIGLKRRPRLAFGVLAGLALCTGLFVESFLPHTDDGCVVETHCLACQLTIGGIATPVATLSAIVRLDQVSLPVWIASEQLRSAATLPALPSRAPPLV